MTTRTTLGRAPAAPRVRFGGLAVAVVGAVLAVVACAHRAEPPPPAARIRDTVPDRKAMLPGADRESDPENVEKRWSQGAASELRRRGDGDGSRGRVDVVESRPRSRVSPALPDAGPDGGR